MSQNPPVTSNDLSGVAGCDGRLFDLLARIEHLVGCRGGWLRLVGLGPPVLDALDQAELPDVLLMYRAARGPVMALVEPASTARDGSGSAIAGAAPLHQTVLP